MGDTVCDANNDDDDENDDANDDVDGSMEKDAQHRCSTGRSAAPGTFLCCCLPTKVLQCQEVECRNINGTDKCAFAFPPLHCPAMVFPSCNAWTCQKYGFVVTATIARKRNRKERTKRFRFLLGGRQRTIDSIAFVATKQLGWVKVTNTCRRVLLELERISKQRYSIFPSSLASTCPRFRRRSCNDQT